MDPLTYTLSADELNLIDNIEQLLGSKYGASFTKQYPNLYAQLRELTERFPKW